MNLTKGTNQEQKELTVNNTGAKKTLNKLNIRHNPEASEAPTEQNGERQQALTQFFLVWTPYFTQSGSHDQVPTGLAPWCNSLYLNL